MSENIDRVQKHKYLEGHGHLQNLVDQLVPDHQANLLDLVDQQHQVNQLFLDLQNYQLHQEDQDYLNLPATYFENHTAPPFKKLSSTELLQ